MIYDLKLLLFILVRLNVFTLLKGNCQYLCLFCVPLAFENLPIKVYMFLLCLVQFVFNVFLCDP